MQYIGFIINNNEYTVPITKVQEIINIPPITKLPQAPSYIEGVMNMRGKIITVVNLKSLMGFYSEDKPSKIIVLSSGKVTFGILVDGITGVITIDKNNIEPSENLIADGVQNIEGVAKLSDRLLIMLDPKRMIPLEDMHLFEDEIIEYKETGEDKVEVVKKVEGIGGDIFVREIIDTKEFLKNKGLSSSHPKVAVLDDIVCFMDALLNHDFEKTNECVEKIINKGQEGLYKELGRLTRKLHDTIKNIKGIDAPRLKTYAVDEMPSAVDNLQLVIQGTENAANRTLEIVEKYLNLIREHKKQVSEEGEESLVFKKDFFKELEKDMTELLITQEFQDLTGRMLKQVITFLTELETEMLNILKDVGIKVSKEEKDTKKQETVDQEGVDSILKDLGF
ncbi:MAG: protein phosphatase CheZ [Thermodesulfovibrionales bacterium]|nr:protein phosphatase CheZ [Thermodesulfovibrionales bacterium]